MLNLTPGANLAEERRRREELLKLIASVQKPVATVIPEPPARAAVPRKARYRSREEFFGRLKELQNQSLGVTAEKPMLGSTRYKEVPPPPPPLPQKFRDRIEPPPVSGPRGPQPSWGSSAFPPEPRPIPPWMKYGSEETLMGPGGAYTDENSQLPEENYEAVPPEPYVPGGGPGPGSTKSPNKILEQLAPDADPQGPARPSPQPSFWERLTGPKTDYQPQPNNPIAEGIGNMLGISPTSVSKGFGLLGKIGMLSGLMGQNQQPPDPVEPAPSPDFAGAYQQQFQAESEQPVSEAELENMASLTPTQLADLARRKKKLGLADLLVG